MVFAVGLIVGAAEISSRHSDHRFQSLATAPGFAYMALNGILSLLALFVIESTRPSWLGYSADATSSPDMLKVVVAAGFGAAAFFRSSIVKLKTQNGEVAFGPALVIDVFLAIIDESVDREMGSRRLNEISVIMKDVDFEKACKNLPTYCFASLRRLPDETQRAFATQLKQLMDSADLDEGVRSASLGLSIMALTGRPVLEKAVTQLGPAIKRSAARTDDAVGPTDGQIKVD